MFWYRILHWGITHFIKLLIWVSVSRRYMACAAKALILIYLQLGRSTASIRYAKPLSLSLDEEWNMRYINTTDFKLVSIAPFEYFYTFCRFDLCCTTLIDLCMLIWASSMFWVSRRACEMVSLKMQKESFSDMVSHDALNKNAFLHGTLYSMRMYKTRTDTWSLSWSLCRDGK